MQSSEDGGYGVVGLTADWRSPADLDEAAAAALAAGLDARGAGIDAVRWVGPHQGVLPAGLAAVGDWPELTAARRESLREVRHGYGG